MNFITGSGMLDQQEPIKLLIVDDDELDRKAIRRGLDQAQLPCRVIEAQDGMQGLDILRDASDRSDLKPVIVLLDLNMPRMNGIEFLDELRRDESLSTTIVFVFSTSRAMTDVRQAYERNVAGYLLKGETSDLEDVIELIRKYWITVEFPHD